MCELEEVKDSGKSLLCEIDRKNLRIMREVVFARTLFFPSRLWDIECGACLRVLEGHEELVRCIRFDNKRIVSGAYDGYVSPGLACIVITPSGRIQQPCVCQVQVLYLLIR